ncbi:MAG: NB-ARC domain-containing protein, partial [Anaerolineae bacterium]|nr:NB-ARC domain-containing protein [Anaerolineae bacterium]
MGGIGKTVLATALCHEQTIIDAFPDGIYWVDVGRDTNDLTNKLQVIGVQGFDDDPSYYVTKDAAIARIQTLVPQKACLIVFDDIWDADIIRPLLVASAQSRFLITTRDGKISTSLGATEVKIDKMTPDEALALLQNCADKSEMEHATITEKLDYHPLALTLVGAALKGGLSGAQWLSLYDNVAQITLGRKPKNPHESMTLCFDVSMECLADDDRPLYYALGIFPEDEWIPDSIVTLLWRAIIPSLSNMDCAQILKELNDLALIERDLINHTLQMHDLLHSYNQYCLRDRYQPPSDPATGNLYAQYQSKLVTALGDPYALPHKYAWRYYAYHLKEANRLAELRPLLLSYRWLDLKLRQTDPNALIDDCDTWLKQASDEAIRLIRSALDMSANVLEKDTSALAHQLAGRLMHHYGMVEIKKFWDNITPLNKSLFPINNGYNALNPAGGMLLRTMKHEDVVLGALQLPKGQVLSWSLDGTLRLWKADGTPIIILSGHDGRVNGTIKLQDGRILSWGEDKTLRIWDKNGITVATLGRDQHQDEVMGGIEIDGGQILSWTGSNSEQAIIKDNSLRVWDTQGSLIATLDGHKGRVRGAIALPSGRIFSWGDDGIPRLWDGDGTSAITEYTYQNPVLGAILLAGERILSWSGGDDMMPRAEGKDFNQRSEMQSNKVDEQSSEIQSNKLGIEDLFNTIVIGNILDKFVISDISDKDLRTNYPEKIRRAMTSVTPQTTSLDDLSARYGLSSPNELRLELQNKSSEAKPDDDIELQNKSSEAKPDDDIELHIWDNDGKLIASLKGHTKRINGAVQLKNKQILTWGADTTLCLWDENGMFITTLTGHTDAVTGALELRDGRILSWSADNTLRLWKTDGTSIAILTEHISRVTGALELHDERILSWSADNKLCLWNKKGKHITTLNEHTGRINGAIQLSNGRVLSWGNDNTLRLWDIDVNQIDTNDKKAHNSDVRHARLVSNNRILSWDDDEFCLWDKDGYLIDTEKRDLVEIKGWLQRYDLTQDDLMPAKSGENPTQADIQHDG